MKVLFQSRTTLFSVPGGDTIQVLKTKEYLERLGVEVDIGSELEPNLADYDLVHLFNLIRPQEVLTQARNARRQGKKIALSTIYVDYSEYDRRARRGLGRWLSLVLPPAQIEYLKTVARAAKNRELHRGTLDYLQRGHRSAQRKIVEWTDVFLPNSYSEMRRVCDDFPSADGKPYVVVPNAVDMSIFDLEKTVVPIELERYRGCVLCVARIEGRKNQLNLALAMRELPWPLVLIGKPAPNHLSYFEDVKKQAGSNVHILEAVEHDQLPGYYKVARVHVLASWMETTGLSSLEAGIMGCSLVITDRGDTPEYFGDLVHYCEPDSVNSIRSAIQDAYEDTATPQLVQHIQEKFNWERTAAKTLEGYRHALKK